MDVNGFEVWASQARRMRAMADRSRFSRLERLRRTCRAAGLDICQLHNAMVGLHYGKSWREVDYSLARLAERQERELFAASAIVDRWAARTMPRG